jgi:oligopeptide/dipeptide ABC transporter ATP-binding protein
MRPVNGPSARAGAAGPGADDAPARPLVEVRDLRVYFPITSAFGFGRSDRVVRAVDGVSLDLARGETLGLVGESGSGKTTTGRAIVRLLDPTGGSVRFDGTEIATLKGEPLRKMRTRFQMIFQDPYSSLNPRMTVGGIVGEPLEIFGIGDGASRRARVAELLDLVGIPGQAVNRYPHEFSGGQRQRVGVARALALNPDLIVADEPISALDVSIRAQILKLLERLQAELGLTYLVVAHDLAAVRRISHRVAVMYLGRVVEIAPTRPLYQAPRHPYTVALLSAVPIPDPAIQRGRRRIILSGEIPNPSAPPPGCHFHTRCWLYQRLGTPERCRTEPPALSVVEPGHGVACHYTDEVAGTVEAVGARGPGGREAAPGDPTRSTGPSAVAEPGLGDGATEPVGGVSPGSPTG